MDVSGAIKAGIALVGAGVAVWILYRIYRAGAEANANKALRARIDGHKKFQEDGSEFDRVMRRRRGDR